MPEWLSEWALEIGDAFVPIFSGQSGNQEAGDRVQHWRKPYGGAASRDAVYQSARACQHQERYRQAGSAGLWRRCLEMEGETKTRGSTSGTMPAGKRRSIIESRTVMRITCLNTEWSIETRFLLARCIPHPHLVPIIRIFYIYALCHWLSAFS